MTSDRDEIAAGRSGRDMSVDRRPTVFLLQRLMLAALSLFAITGCSDPDERLTITLWHQMTVGERNVLDDRIAEFERENPDLRVKSLYKETEMLRSAFEAAAQAGIGPELIFGPSDPLGTMVAMGIVQDMSPWFAEEHRADFLEQGLTYLPGFKRPDEQWLVQIGDRVGNHLALIYNRDLIESAPRTTDEMIAVAIAATRDHPDGKQYGLVWNFIEPFFFVPFLTGYGGWVFEEGTTIPALNTEACISALSFVADLQNKHRVMPANCDYETADSLFKEGKAAMIINGDWSWSLYLENENIDAAVAPLPIVSQTGLPMGPMVATKGYSLNAQASPERASAAMKLVRFMTSAQTQQEFMRRLKTLPSRRSLLQAPEIAADPTLQASMIQMQQGRTSPVAPELRAVWDGMRPPYQELLGGGISAAAAAQEMQRGAIRRIDLMNAQSQPTTTGKALQLLALVLLVATVVWYRHSWINFVSDLRNQPFSYLLIGPAMIVIGLTIVYPFIYNILLSFSNMSLHNFQQWQITGFQNYVQAFTEPKFFMVLTKTLIWTAVCVFFHIAIGLLLAACLNGPVAGKSIYRILLILPWAIPAYITALTWRGMFNYEYGAINLILTRWLGMEEGLNWLGEEYLAFAACIITNIWLGFPFMMVIALGGMQGIPQELYEAARIDRVSRWQQFRYITLPMLKPVLIPATTLGAIWTFNNLNVVWLVTNAGEPADKSHILVSYVYKAVFNSYQYGYGAALSMVIFALLLFSSLIFLRRTQATEGVK